MPRKKTKPKAIEDANQLKALAHPLRMQVYEFLIDRAATAKQVAEAFDSKPTRFYHHFALLERASLIRLVETRRKRGTTEKYYRAISATLSLDDDHFADRRGDVAALRISALQSAIYELLDNQNDASRQTVVRRLSIRTTRAQAQRLREQLDDFIDACLEAQRRNGRTEFGITVAMCPRKQTRKGAKE